MSEALWGEVLRRTEEGRRGAELARDAERIARTAEVFTPSELAVRMVRDIPTSHLAPGRSVLDPACGDGQFLDAVRWAKVLMFDIDSDQALRDIYGVDIMVDNVAACRRRLGGGTILVGDTLRPNDRVSGQSERDHRLMVELFGFGNLMLF